jgi:hypothetical protein
MGRRLLLMASQLLVPAWKISQRSCLSFSGLEASSIGGGTCIGDTNNRGSVVPRSSRVVTCAETPISNRRRHPSSSLHVQCSRLKVVHPSGFLERTHMYTYMQNTMSIDKLLAVSFMSYTITSAVAAQVHTCSIDA